jgi:hypothetical protein
MIFQAFAIACPLLHIQDIAQYLSIGVKRYFTPLEDSYSAHRCSECTQSQNCLTNHLGIKIESDSKIMMVTI